MQLIVRLPWIKVFTMPSGDDLCVHLRWKFVFIAIMRKTLSLINESRTKVWQCQCTLDDCLWPSVLIRLRIRKDICMRFATPSIFNYAMVSNQNQLLQISIELIQCTTSSYVAFSGQRKRNIYFAAVSRQHKRNNIFYYTISLHWWITSGWLRTLLLAKHFWGAAAGPPSVLSCLACVYETRWALVHRCRKLFCGRVV